MNSLKIFVVLTFFCVFAVGSLCAQESGESSARANYEEGVRLMQANEIDEGIAYLEKAKDLGPGHPQIRNALAVAYLQANYPLEDPLRELEEAIRLDPGFADAYCNLGVLYSSPEYDYAMAEEYYLKAVALEPEYSRPYFGLGWINLVRKGDAAQAVVNFEKAVELNGNYTEAQFYLGMSYLAAGERHKVLSPVSQLRRMNRGDLALSLEALMEGDAKDIRRYIGGTGR